MPSASSAGSRAWGSHATWIACTVLAAVGCERAEPAPDTGSADTGLTATDAAEAGFSDAGSPDAGAECALDAGPEDARCYRSELGLPVFHLEVAPEINGDAYTPAALRYGGREYFGVSAKYRGSTSSRYPKRSLTLKFDRDALFSDEVLGFPGTRRLVLTSTFDDNSQLRQRLAFELWNRLDDAHIQIRHFNAVVYLNGAYQGVYAVTDHVNDDFMRAAGLPEDVNMYKARTQDANLRLTDNDGHPKVHLRVGYTKEEGWPGADAEGAYDDLEALVSFIATASDEDFRAQMNDRLAPDFEDWFVFVTLIAAVDTTKKNYFLIHDPRLDAPDPRWRFIPWDFNASFGQTTRTLPRGADTYDLDRLARGNRLFERLFADPRLRAHLMARYHAALAGRWAVSEVLAMFDRFAAEVGPAAERDERRWGEERREFFSERTDFVDHRTEIAFMRTWIEERWTVIAAQLD
jgi:spore coat protein CotH